MANFVRRDMNIPRRFRTVLSVSVETGLLPCPSKKDATGPGSISWPGEMRWGKPYGG